MSSGTLARGGLSLLRLPNAFLGLLERFETPSSPSLECQKSFCGGDHAADVRDTRHHSSTTS
jgi:hypothetical protein